jgi:hypothetical protein
MQRFERADRTSNVTSGQPALEIIAGAKGCRVLAIKISLVTAVATVLGIGRPAAKGITPTTPLSFVSQDNDTPASSTTALAWGTPPTAPATFFERWSSTGAIGGQKDFIFAQGLWIPPGLTLTVHNITGGATLDIVTDIQEPRS